MRIEDPERLHEWTKDVREGIGDGSRIKVHATPQTSESTEFDSFDQRVNIKNEIQRKEISFTRWISDAVVLKHHVSDPASLWALKRDSKNESASESFFFFFSFWKTQEKERRERREKGRR